MIRKLGPYDLSDILGRGGMGTVYRARHRETGEEFAVKVLAPYYASDPHFRRRFEAEIQALIKLDHPNIVRLISYGQEGEHLFFAMELVRGRSLFQMQKEGIRFDWRDVLAIARDICQGLRHAHERGVIHRDLKPGNLLKPDDGPIKITDFGIAKSFGMTANTGSNVLGTMDFMSPEQAKGQPVTVRSDLYSLGTVMYCLLAGRPPFTGNSVEEAIRNLTSVPAPRVRHAAPEVPRELDEVIASLLSKDPAQRVPTALALLHQLEAVENHLRHDAEAQTAEVSDMKSHDTFDLKTPSTPSDSANTAVGESTMAGSSEGGSSRTAGATIDERIRESEGSGKHVTYFNTVTEQQRKKQAGVDDEDSGPNWSQILGVGIPLLLIVALAVWGIGYVTRPPSPDELYQVISAEAERPHRVRDEIRQFLELYPDDERASEIEQLDELADAIALFNRLSIRANSAAAADLTDLERELVATVQLSRTDSAAAYNRLQALLTLYGHRSELSDNEQRCLDAARAYLAKIRRDAEQRRLVGQDQIQWAMEKAANASPDEARQIYRSIIELYRNASWARDLVAEAKRKLDELE